LESRDRARKMGRNSRGVNALDGVPSTGNVKSSGEIIHALPRPLPAKFMAIARLRWFRKHGYAAARRKLLRAFIGRNSGSKMGQRYCAIGLAARRRCRSPALGPRSAATRWFPPGATGMAPAPKPSRKPKYLQQSRVAVVPWKWKVASKRASAGEAKSEEKPERTERRQVRATSCPDRLEPLASRRSRVKWQTQKVETRQRVADGS
jgi:hypothetical protein